MLQEAHRACAILAFLIVSAPALAQEPKALGKKEVQAGLTDKAFKGAVMQCTVGYMPPGKLWLHVTITSKGEVSINAIKPKPPTDAIDSCIRKAAGSVTFRESAKTINVIWPFNTGTGSGVWVEEKPPEPEEPEEGTVEEGGGDVVQTGACVPECRPGYFCKAGQCVSLCNPPCASDERCDPDLGDCVAKSPPAAATHAKPPPPPMSQRYSMGDLKRSFYHYRSMQRTGVVMLVLGGLSAFTGIMLLTVGSSGAAISKSRWGAGVGLTIFAGVCFPIGLPMTIVGSIKKGYYERRIDHYAAISIHREPWLLDRNLSW